MVGNLLSISVLYGYASPGENQVMYEQVEVGENLGAEHERSDPATSHEMGFDICGSS